MTNTWQSILRQLEPEYDKLAEMAKEGPKVKAFLRKINGRWRVRIEEDWVESNGENYYTADYSNLDSRCNWAEEQLKNWKDVTRLSHQEWKFFTRKQAEKFLVIYNIVWTE